MLEKLFLSIILGIGLIVLVSPVYASTVTVDIPAGTSVPGCEESNSCYAPADITINAGDTVEWVNVDTAAHTVTSGNSASGPSGVFDSGLFMADAMYTFTFDDAGSYDYFCMVHPWMEGLVTVQKNTMNSPTENSWAVQGYVDLVYFTLTSGSILDMTLDTDASSLIVGINSNQDGSLMLTIPRSILDAKINGNDENFFVLIDGVEVPFEETTTSADRKLTIEFPAGAEEIEIIGTSIGGNSKSNTTINVPPTIKYQISTLTAYPDKNITFDASASFDSDGTITKYDWWFGDGSSASGKIVSHKYSAQGAYTAVLKITDDADASSQQDISLTILSPVVNGGGGSDYLIYIVGLVIIIGIGVGIFAFSRSKKSIHVEESISSTSSTNKIELGHPCNVCGTIIPEGQNVCPGCGDTYSI